MTLQEIADALERLVPFSSGIAPLAVALRENIDRLDAEELQRQVDNEYLQMDATP